MPTGRLIERRKQRLCVGIFRFPDRHRIAVIILPECQILLVPVRRHRIQCKSRDQRVKGFDAALLFRLNPVTHPRVAIPRCIPILAVDLCQPIKVLCAVLLCHSQQVARRFSAARDHLCGKVLTSAAPHHLPRRKLRLELGSAIGGILSPILPRADLQLQHVHAGIRLRFDRFRPAAAVAARKRQQSQQ